MNTTQSAAAGAATRVSIVIPTFNRAGLVTRAIDTALAQTVPSEVIVCDHGSTDDTPTAVARYGNAIRYVRRARDQGPIVCWRDGVEQATGELIHINYDDDWIDPTFVEKTLPLLREDVAFVYTRIRIHEPDPASSKVRQRHPAGIRPVGQLIQYLLRKDLPISPGCALFRRSDVLKNLLVEIPGAQGSYGKNSGVGEDLLLFLLATLDYPRYAHLPEAVSHFLAHPTSITTHAAGSGKLAALVNAYSVAKRHYLRQPGSMQPAKGLHAKLGKLWWKLTSRRG